MSDGSYIPLVENRPSAPFQAGWNNDNEIFKEKYEEKWTRIDKIAACVFFPFTFGYLIFKYLGSKFLHNQILPKMSQKDIDYSEEIYRITWSEELNDGVNLSPDGQALRESTRFMRENFTAERKTVITPDGAELNVILVRPNDYQSEELPTVIHWHGNAETAAGAACANPELLKASLTTNHPRNFVFPDYRSRDKFTRIKDLFVDASSVVQYVQKELKTSSAKIVFSGHSLGGYVAAAVQGENPDKYTGPTINMSSFTSIRDVTAKIKIVGRCFSQFPQWWGYDAMNAVDALNKLKGAKLILGHKQDPEIAFGARVTEKKVKGAKYCILELSKEDASAHSGILSDFQPGLVDGMNDFLTENGC